MSVVRIIALLLMGFGAVASLALAAMSREPTLLMPAALFASASMLVLKSRKKKA